MPDWGDNLLGGSLEAVARLAARETGACGFRIGSVVLGNWNGGTLIIYPLQNDRGIEAAAAFSFATAESAEAARVRLDRLGAAIQAIWRAHSPERYWELVRRLETIEAKLTDSKIVDRAEGLLEASGDGDAVDSIARHVESVLGSSPAREVIERLVSGIEEELEERKLVSEAKRILQETFGVSEGQAHAELRAASRKSRTRMKEIATQVIQRQHLLKGRTA